MFRLITFAATAAALLIAVPASRAADGWAVDFSTVLKDDTGKAPIKDCDKFEEGVVYPAVPKCIAFVDVTLGRLASAVLNTPEQGLSNGDIQRRGYLARAIRMQPKQNLSADDVKMLTDLIYKRGFSPVMTLDAIELLDPASLKK